MNTSGKGRHKGTAELRGAAFTPTGSTGREPRLGTRFRLPPTAFSGTASPPAMEAGRCFFRLLRLTSASGSIRCCQQVTLARKPDCCEASESRCSCDPPADRVPPPSTGRRSVLDDERRSFTADNSPPHAVTRALVLICRGTEARRCERDGRIPVMEGHLSRILKRGETVRFHARFACEETFKNT
jgi:hypothetical protein